MLKALKIWYYKRLFIKIYFRYLNGSDPQNLSLIHISEPTRP
mgnify:CR=1 FL=1